MIKYSEASGLYYEIKGEGAGSYAVITDAKKKQSTFDVPGLIEGVPVREIGKKAFLGCKALREVTLPASVEKLGEWAFAFCDNLTVVRMARMKTELGKGIFKNDRKLKDIIVYDEEMKPGTVSRLLAAAPIYMDAEYLLDTQHAGTDEWYVKWDTRLSHILSLKDDEGYHLYVLCGEEDLHFDYDQYLEYNREKKSYLCMLRLVNDTGLKDAARRELASYIKDHTALSESDAALRVLLKDFGDERDYYDLMIDGGAINPNNLEAVLEAMGDRHAQMKAYVIERCGSDDSLDSLML